MRTALLGALLAGLAAAGESETPPKGPPWQRDLHEARKQALAQGKPLFLYFTKTYWPHCVVVEKQLLPNPALKKVYDEVIWVYVYRDFTSKGLDHAAERISWRFGVTSWPQLFLADPETLEILKHTGRQPESFLQAVAQTKVKATRSQAALEKTAEAERFADDLEKRGTVKLAKQGLDHEDIVVRYLSLRILKEKDPDAVAARAGDLLAVPNDPFRYEVCEVLGKLGDKKAKKALEQIVVNPKDSLNPNVLRIRAVQALKTCGDAASVGVIAPFASSGAYFNGLTGISIDTLAAIAGRDKKAKKAVKKVLKTCYPEPPDPSDERAMRACVALAKRVHKALGSKPGFPGTYDEKARRKLMSE